MIGRTYYFISSILFLVGIFVFLSPALISPDLIYPERMDSAFISFHAGKDNDTLLFSPADVGLSFSELQVTNSEGFKLNGWYASATDTPANTILILHDLNESKLLYIDHMKQFHDRGFNVSVFDLRAHGSSGGNEFTPGLPAVEDAKLMIAGIYAKKETRNLIIMGVGIGSAIALQVAVYDTLCRGLVLQSPFNNLGNYLNRYARIKWGIMKNIWYPVFIRRIENLLRYPIKQLDLTEIASYISIPTVILTGSDGDENFTTEAMEVYNVSAAEKKELFLVKNNGLINIAKAGGEEYYNRISAFLIESMPKEQKITRFKKMVLNDR
jgi:pimeloyl-ACP methyl ester carboxylesterase